MCYYAYLIYSCIICIIIHTIMGLYTFLTSKTSYLDKIHGPYWESLSALITVSFPWVTSTIMTIIGILPVFILYCLYISQTISSIAVNGWLFYALCFYVNVDAIAGKLNKLKSQTTSYEKIISNSCFVLTSCFTVLMLFGSSDYSMLSYSYRILIFITLLSICIVQLIHNLVEFYTGIVKNLDSCFGAVEYVYLLGNVSCILSKLYLLETETLPFLIQIIFMFLIMLQSVLFTISSINVLINPNTKTQTQKKLFDIYDIKNCVIAIGLSIFMVYMADFSQNEIAMSIMYLTSFVIDIIFSNVMKTDIIIFNNIILNILILKCILLFFCGPGFITVYVNAICISRFIADNLKKMNIVWSK